jgi:protoporphyrinogen oxidase
MENGVVVVGGGISGLTAAWKLAAAGVRVTVLEAEAVPGGQARAFDVDGHIVEHGSHAFFGYYQTVLGLIDDLRTDAQLPAAVRSRMPGLVRIPGWTLVDAYGRRALIQQSAGWPRLLSVVPSILAVPWFDWRDKLGALIGAYRLINTPFARFVELDAYTSEEYAQRVGYTQLGAVTWNSASLGLTNLFVDEQSAAIFAGKHKVLMGTAAGLSYQLPAGDLSWLFAEPARAKVQALGGQVRTGVRVTGLEPGAPVRIRCADGTTLSAGQVILAVQPWDAHALLPSVTAPWTGLEPVTPVITMVVGLSGMLPSSTDAAELGLSREQWAFSVVTDLSRFWPAYAGNKTVLRAEIGHADRLPRGLDTPDDELLRMVKLDIDRLFPGAASLSVEWMRLHREPRHLYVRWVRGAFARHPTPAQRVVADNVFLAGDWTSKGTIGMESAANSGIEAANYILASRKLPLISYTDVPLD